jgi:aspartyl aminopeptidase
VDTQPAVIGGISNEFIFSPRLDNLMMSFCALTSLLDFSSNVEKLSNEKNVSMIVLFDHEEVGSQSAHGAASPIVNEIVRRITSNPQVKHILHVALVTANRILKLLSEKVF